MSLDAYTPDGIKRLEDKGVTDVMVGFRIPYVVGPDTAAAGQQDPQARVVRGERHREGVATSASTARGLSTSSSTMTAPPTMRRPASVRGGHHLQGAGRLGSGVAVQRLSQSGDEDLVGARHVTRHDEDGGVEQVHRGRDDLADVPAAVPDHPARLGVAAVGEFDDVAQVPDRVVPAAAVRAPPPSRLRWPRGNRCHRSDTEVPCAAAILLCPNSPAACVAPRCSTPPAMMPAPRPVDAFSTRTSCRGVPAPLRPVRSRWRRCRAPRAHPKAVAAQRSTAAGPRRPSREGSASPGCNRGRGRPFPEGSARPRRRARRGNSSQQHVEPLHHVGHQIVRARARPPDRCRRWTARSPARLHTASRVRLMPTATDSTTPASASKESNVGGRPPVDGACSRSPTRPSAIERRDPGGDGGPRQAGELGDLGARGVTTGPDQGEDIARRWSCLD